MIQKLKSLFTLKLQKSEIDIAYYEYLKDKQLAFIPYVISWGILGLCMFIYMDLFLRKIPIWSLVRIPSLILMIITGISYYWKWLSKDKLYILYLAIFFSVMSMMFIMIFFVYGDFERNKNIISGTIAAIFIIYVSVLGGAKVLIPIYFIPFSLFLLYVFLFPGADKRLIEFINPFAVMLACIVVGEATERLRKREFILSRELNSEKKITEALTKLDKFKDEFMANTSHELQTPLNGIMGISDSLIDGATGPLPKQTVENLKMISYSARRLSNLVNDILDFSKLKENEIYLSVKTLSVKQAVEIAINLCKHLIQDKNLELRNEITEDVYYVLADENRFQQILLNLLGNAIKFTDKGFVVVHAKDIEENGKTKIAISITDTGIGISQDKFSIIFKAFEQADSSTSREYGGTGLGLSITQKLVELHGGSIHVTSQVAKGSTFTFTLPAINKTEVEETTRLEKNLDTEKSSVNTIIEFQKTGERTFISKEESKQLKNNFIILAVDDEPINLQVLKNQLGMAGYEVITSSSGIEAIEMLESDFLPDIILLDVMMPRMSGYEVCRKIREKYPIANLPILMLTAKNQVTNLVEGSSLGANDYISKPFDKQELLTRISTHLHVSNISNAYNRFVPIEILKLLNCNSISELQLGDHIQKEMTILFADIRSFTTMSEEMSPKENFEFINNYLSRVGPIVRKHGGYIDKYIGDAIMALYPNKVEDGLDSAIGIQSEIYLYNQQILKQGHNQISVGIGLHYGSLILGTIGENKRIEGTVISDAVNLASRVENLTKKYSSSILVTDELFSKIEKTDKYYYRIVDKVRVKGKRKFIQVIEILNGQPEESIDLFIKTKEIFELSAIAYWQKEFDKAVELFSQVLKINPSDKTAGLYLDRAKYYHEHGVPFDWEGIETMDSK